MSDAPKIVAFPVDKLEDTVETRSALKLIRNGLMRPGPEISRAMAMEILKLWGDPDWDKY